jgi:hypothetical protein
MTGLELTGIMAIAAVPVAIIMVALFRSNRHMKAQIFHLKRDMEALTKAPENKETNEEHAEPETKRILDGLVEITEKQRPDGRTMVSYNVTDNMPKFGTVREAVSFSAGILTTVDDPTLLSLVNHGPVMKTDLYFALKMVMRSIIGQIESLSPADEEEPEESPAESSEESSEE